MKRYQIESDWSLSFSRHGTRKEIAASVPGNVTLDLLHADLIEDPYHGDSVHTLVAWEHTDWTYQSTITPPAIEPGESAAICFDGIDTVATILIDGEAVENSRNMFVPVSVDITSYAQSNTTFVLTVEIRSAVNAMWDTPIPAGASALPYNYPSVFLRKARHSFGWDIAPRIITAGLWRPVWIEIRRPVEIEELYIYTEQIDPLKASISVDWRCTLPHPDESVREGTLTMTVVDPDGAVTARRDVPVRFPRGKESFEIDSPRCWWPAGYGSPELYSLEVSLEWGDGTKADPVCVHFGIRLLELVRSDAVAGSSKRFEIRVNGVPIFVRGSNWVPSDAFHSRAQNKAIDHARPYLESGCNILRIWGGGIYEDERLFDYCDRHGIMIWQDFMFACEIPVKDDRYDEAVRSEIESIAKQYRNHPSLILWCGDNENDAAARQWGPERTGQNHLTRELIPSVLASHDPYRPYLPSSPYISDEAWAAHADNISASIPEQHLWGPRDAYKGEFYASNTAVFASEIGYHGCPEPESIARFLDAQALDRNSAQGVRQWRTHASQPYGDQDGRYAYRIALMSKQIGMLFGSVPESTDRYAAASQISQAEAKKFFIELFRMSKFERTGIIWWNMQDMWPQFSDAVIDYYGRRKLAWHYISRAQQTRCLMVSEPSAWSHEVIGVNDTRDPVAGTFSVVTHDGAVVVPPTEFSIEANGRQTVGAIDYDSSAHRLYLVDWTLGEGATPSHGRNHYVAGAPPLDLDCYLSNWLPAIAAQRSEDANNRQAGDGSEQNRSSWLPGWLDELGQSR